MLIVTGWQAVPALHRWPARCPKVPNLPALSPARLAACRALACLKQTAYQRAGRTRAGTGQRASRTYTRVEDTPTSLDGCARVETG